MVRDADRAEDLAQETLAVALAKPPEDASRLRAWLASVMRNPLSRPLKEMKVTRSYLGYLNIAIDQTLTVSVPYYFRASWKVGTRTEDFPAGHEFNFNEMVSDLETACQLDPEWDSPRTLLERVRENPSDYKNLE